MSEQKTRKQIILATVSDLAGSFMYYDRIEDDELERGDIEKAIENGEITKQEILDHFSKECEFE